MIWIIWFLFILLEAYYNHVRITKGKKIYHGINAAYRIILWAWFVWVMYKFHAPLSQIIMFTMGAFFSYWLIFNITLNWLQARPIDYLGKESILDRWESKLPWIFTTFAKIVCASGFIYAYFHVDLL